MTVNVYSIGVCAMSVCAPTDMAREQVEREANEAHPTGLDHPWRIADGCFQTGEPNPYPVEGCGVHWLLVC